MELRKNKNEPDGISLLGFGLMRLPLAAEGGQAVDRAKAREMVDYAVDHGINYFDTAWMYHDGDSERFAGEALSAHDRGKFFLASKMPLAFLKEPGDVERIFNEQLKKCKVEYFDFYLLHNIDREHFRIAESCNVYDQLKEKQKQGLIRHLGFSFHDRPDLLARVTSSYDWDFAQIQLNYLDWEQQNSKEQYEILYQKGIPVTVMEPVRGGALAKLPETALAIFKAADPHAGAASWALRFAASLPGVQTVLSGMTTLEQMKENISTMENFTALNDGEYQVIKEALVAYKSSGAVPCTACRYCMDCPSGVDIPRILAVYNNYLLNKSENHPMAGFLFDMEYKLPGPDKQAARCVDCGRCESLCPQHLKIPSYMKEIDSLYEERKSAPGPHSDFLKKE
ncbi:MAG: aldo/keto reductase [Treponema sp.]|jgi:predicted aldo/keto reductase-like oxidoreductase|nr:aldo/keto reductase [Treponema sp.]